MNQRLLLVTPVRNEQAHIETVAAALVAQTRPPDLWLVVDDGSSDETPAILERLAGEIDFMRVLDTSQASQVGAVKDRLATAAEARAFNLALASVERADFTHVGKLDGDIELPPRYFQLLLQRFAQDPRLGLAGGMYADPDPGGDGWKRVSIPADYHVPGALKCYSLPCFEAIGGIREQLGWDTIDETYARMRGYRTRSYADLTAHHHRPWGSADGTLRGRARHGECAYVAHYSLPWVCLRAVKLARTRPRVLSGLAFLYGFLRSGVRRVPQLPDPAFRRFVREEQRSRIGAWLRRPADCRRQAPTISPASGFACEHEPTRTV